MKTRTTFWTTLLVTTLLATAGLATGCGSDNAPSCAKVADHVAKLAQMELPADRRAGMIAECEKQPAAKRSCALAAKTVEALAACR